MNQFQKMALKPQEKLVTRLFLSPKLRQSLKILSAGSNDLVKKLKEVATVNPFASLKVSNEAQNIDWIKDSNSENLQDHLISQIKMTKLTKREEKACLYLIYHLENGYLRTDLNQLASQSEFSYQELLLAKENLQELEPLGIASEDLAECLLIQAKAQKDFNQVALAILQNKQLEILAAKDWEQLPYSKAAIAEALAAIQTLNPRPASEYENSEPTQYLLPDLIYSWQDDQLLVKNNQDQIPELVFDEKTYEKMKTQVDAEDYQYLELQKKQVLDLQQAVKMRYQTLLKIGKYLGQKQILFFETKDEEKIKPLGVKEIGAALHLAPSTISRCLKDKYFQFEHQIYSAKFLLPRKATEGYSQRNIEKKIQKLINEETSPLSDEKIAQILKLSGIEVSRRLVTKYRQRLGIASSYRRK